MKDTWKETTDKVIKDTSEENKRETKNCFGKLFEWGSGHCIRCGIETQSLCEFLFMEEHPEKYN